MAYAWQSVEEAAVTLGVSSRTLHRRISKGEVETRLEDGRREVLVCLPDPEPEVADQTQGMTDDSEMLGESPSATPSLRAQFRDCPRQNGNRPGERESWTDRTGAGGVSAYIDVIAAGGVAHAGLGANAPGRPSRSYR